MLLLCYCVHGSVWVAAMQLCSIMYSVMYYLYLCAVCVGKSHMGYDCMWNLMNMIIATPIWSCEFNFYKLPYARSHRTLALIHKQPYMAIASYKFTQFLIASEVHICMCTHIHTHTHTYTHTVAT